MQIRRVVVGLLVAVLLFGCSEKEATLKSPNKSPSATDGANLLGLVDNRSLTYLQTDTTRDTAFNLQVVTTIETVGVNGDGEDWIVSNGDVPIVNLKVTDGWVIQNGYWTPDSTGSYEISYFAIPPVVIPRTLNPDDTWNAYTAHFSTNSENRTLIFYYSYFGFFSIKKYVGTQLLHLPAGSFEAHRFDIQLYDNPSYTAPVAEVEEYYVPAVGLVQLNFRAGSFKRTLSLITYQ